MNDFLTNILGWLSSFLGNYGWAVVVFTILIRLVLMPFDYKSRVSMRKMAKRKSSKRSVHISSKP